MKLIIAMVAAISFFSLSTYGQKLMGMDQIIAQFSKLTKPSKTSSSYEHWKYNTYAQSALFCWAKMNKGKKAPDILEKYVPTTAGSFALPAVKDDRQFCKSLGEKPLAPYCVSGLFWAKGVKRRTDLPLDYIQLAKSKPIEIEGTLKCYLNKDQLGEQTYVGPIRAEWAEKPSKKEINTYKSKQLLEMGTLLISAPQVLNSQMQPYTEIRMAILSE